VCLCVSDKSFIRIGRKNHEGLVEGGWREDGGRMEGGGKEGMHIVIFVVFVSFVFSLLWS